MSELPPQYWLRELHDRLADYGRSAPTGASTVSVKLKVESGCFCKSCCPEGHRIISDHLRRHPLSPAEGRLVDHESGPEILTYLSYAAGVTSLSAAVIQLVATIIQARATGIRNGDKRGYPFKLVIRRTDGKKEFKEELIMTIPPDAEIDMDSLAKKFVESARRFEQEPKKISRKMPGNLKKKK